MAGEPMHRTPPTWPEIAAGARRRVGQARDEASIRVARDYVKSARLLAATTADDFDLLDQLDAEIDKRAAEMITVETVSPPHAPVTEKVFHLPESLQRQLRIKAELPPWRPE